MDLTARSPANIVVHTVSSQTLPNEVILVILAHLDAASLVVVFRVSRLFNQLALVTHYAQNNVPAPFSHASFTPSIFPGLSLTIPVPALQSLTFTFHASNVLHTLNALGSFCARLPQPIPSIHLIFPYDLLSSLHPIPQTHTLLKSVESLLTATTDSGKGQALIRFSPLGVHLIPASSPLLPELNHFNPKRNAPDTQARTTEEARADREPQIVGMLLFTVLLGQINAADWFRLTPMGCVAILISVTYFGWWYLSRWKKRWRPITTAVECEGVVRSVPSMTSLTTIEIKLRLEQPSIIGAGSPAIMRPLLVFDQETTESLCIPPTSEVPISSLDLEEFVRDVHLPELRKVTVEVGSDSCLAHTSLFSFFTRHPSIRILTYGPSIFPPLRSPNTPIDVSRSQGLLPKLVLLRASPEFISCLAHCVEYNEAGTLNMLPPRGFLPTLRKLIILPRPRLRPLSTTFYSSSFVTATDIALCAFSSRSAALQLELTVPEDGHEDDWVKVSEISRPQNDASNTSTLCIPCVTILSLYWFPRRLTPAIPLYLQRFPALERLGLMELVWDTESLGAGGAATGKGSSNKGPEDRRMWRVEFIRELRLSCPHLSMLMIGQAERELDDWEAIFAMENMFIDKLGL